MQMFQSERSTGVSLAAAVSKDEAGPGLSRRQVLAAATTLTAGTWLATRAGAAQADGRVSQSRTQIVAAEISARTTEQDRTQCSYTASDLRSTGYYLPPDTPLDVEVARLSAAEATLVVGAPDSDPDPDYREPREYPLKAGRVTISDPAGGVIYYKVIGESGFLKATLGEKAMPMPYFIYGVTQEETYQNQLDERDTPYVELISEHAMITIERSAALRFRGEDHATLLATYEELIKIEDVTVAGMRGDVAVHSRLVHPYHFVGYPGSLDGVAAYATFGHMSFPRPIQPWLLTVQELRTDGWGVYHELGHQHQQLQIKAGPLSEVTVNIYSLAVNAAFAKRFGQVPRLHAPNGETGLTPWQTAVPKIGRDGIDYASSFDHYEQLVMFEQLRLSFDDFWPNLHRYIREEKPAAGDADPDERRFINLVVVSSLTAGYDLIDFFTAWGVPIYAETRSKVAALDLSKPPTDPTTVRDEGQAALARRLLKERG